MEDKSKQSPFGNETPKGLLYHYTTLDGLMGIINHDCLWATHVKYMNDTTEFEDAFSEENIDALIKKLLEVHNSYKELKELIVYYKQDRDTFVISFTDDDDSPTSTPGDRLSQWRAYCGSYGGYSIGFDSGLMTDILVHHDTFTKSCSYYPLYQLLPCAYSPEKKNEIFDRIKAFVSDHFIMSNVIEDTPLGLDAPNCGNYQLLEAACSRYLLDAARFKHPSFSEEREWRCVFYRHIDQPMQQGPENKPDVLYRTGRFGVTPYIQMPLELANERSSPLKRIVVGPQPRMEESAIAVRMLLKSKGINDVEVVESKIPYRNW